MIKFFDTNILLKPEYLATITNNQEKFLISSETLKELENIKFSFNKSEDVKYLARNAVRFLEDNENLFNIVIVNQSHYDIVNKFNLPLSPDNLILACAYDYKDCCFVSRDLLARQIGKYVLHLNLGKLEVNNKNTYTGFKEITLNDDEMSSFYCNMGVNIFGCLINEYLVIQNSDGEVVDKYRWSGELFRPLKYNQVNNSFIGKVKPKNLEQELAFDLLHDNNIKVKVLRGKYGVGKDFLMASIGLDLVGKHKFDKIIWVRNNIPIKNSREIGFIPGSSNQKLKPYCMPFADHIGGEDGLDLLINQGKFVVEHFGTIRGRDLKNSIVICSEAENMTKEHIKLLIGRISDGSELWINGDTQQIDSIVFEENNGLSAVVDSLKGNELFGFVQLQKTERSRVAELAELIQ